MITQDSIWLEAVRAYRAGKLSRREAARLLAADGDAVTVIKNGLETSIERREFNEFDLFLLAGLSVPSQSYCPVLCRALDEFFDDMDCEDIAVLLGDIGDSRAIPCLSKLVDIDQESDEFHALNVKAVQSLARIPAPEALAVLERAKGSEFPEVRLAASREITKRTTT